MTTLFGEDFPFSSYTFALIDDNCKIPAKSLLYRLRTREMLELSASRWDPTPAAATATATAAQNSFASLLDESFNMTTKPVHHHHQHQHHNHNSNSNNTSPSLLGPKVPRRQISPPVQKRDKRSKVPASYTTTADTAPATQELSPPPPPPPSPSRMGSPCKPIRTRSPRVQPRSLLGGNNDDLNASSSSLAAEVSMSLMLSSSSQPRKSNRQLANSSSSRSSESDISTHNAQDSFTAATLHQQRSPRMPQRNNSGSKPHAKEKKAAIQQILQDCKDDNEDNHDNGVDVDFDSSTPSLLLMSEMDSTLEGRQSSSSRRPSLPARQSSFEILPATLPTRQSSFELRHRGASPLTEKVVAEILHHSPSPERTQSSTSMPELPWRRDSDDSIQADVAAKLHCSLPNMYLCQDDDQEEEEESEHPSKAQLEKGRQHCPQSRFRSTKTRPSTRPATKKDDAPLVFSRPQKSVASVDPPPVSNSSIQVSKASASSSTAAAKESPYSSTDHITDRGGSVTIACSAHTRTPMPRKPTRQWSLDSQSSIESSAESTNSKCKARRFRRFLTGSSSPSLMVRSSSFNFVGGDTTSSSSGPTAVGKLPGRHSSFPGLHSTFQKI